MKFQWLLLYRNFVKFLIRQFNNHLKYLEINTNYTMRTSKYKNSEQENFCKTTTVTTHHGGGLSENTQMLQMNNQIFRSCNPSPKKEKKPIMGSDIHNKENWESQAAQIQNQIMNQINLEKNQCSELTNIQKQLEMRLNSIKLNELSENVDFKRNKTVHVNSHLSSCDTPRSETNNDSNPFNSSTYSNISFPNTQNQNGENFSKDSTRCIEPTENKNGAKIFNFVPVSHDLQEKKESLNLNELKHHTSQYQMNRSFLSIVSDTRNEGICDVSSIENKRQVSINPMPLSTTNSMRAQSTKSFDNQLQMQMLEMERNHNTEVDRLQKEILKLTKELNAANINSTTATINSFKQFEMNNNSKLNYDREKKQNEELEQKINTIEVQFQKLRLEYQLSIKQRDNLQLEIDIMRKTSEKKLEAIQLQANSSEDQRREMEKIINHYQEEQKKIEMQLNFEIEEKVQIKAQLHEIQHEYKQKLDETKNQTELRSKLAFQSELTQINLNSEQTRTLYDQLQTNYQNLLQENDQLKNFLTQQERDFLQNKQKIREMEAISNQINLYQIQNMRLGGVVEELEQEQEQLIRQQFETKDAQEQQISNLKSALKNQAAERMNMKRNIEEMIERMNNNGDLEQELANAQNRYRQLHCEIENKNSKITKLEEELKVERQRSEKSLKRIVIFGGEIERLHLIISNQQSECEKHNKELDDYEQKLMQLQNSNLELEQQWQALENEKQNPNSIYVNQYDELKNECERQTNIANSKLKEIDYLQYNLQNLEQSPAIIAELEKRLRLCMIENQRLNQIIFQRCQTMVAPGGW